MTTSVSFTVIGTPIPQGSKARNRFGGVREDNPNTRPWRATVAATASEAWNGAGLLGGTLMLTADFYFQRPRSHYRTGKLADKLKATAPLEHTTKPDLDKLIRAIGDALTGVVIVDDAKIAILSARKMYGAPARAEIRVRQVA